MGILDSILGTGQGSGSPTAAPGEPYQPGMLGGLQAYLAPGMYQARQQGFAQKQAYDALRGTGQAPADMAGALATNPQMMQQAGGAYLPSAPEAMSVPGPFGEPNILQKKTAPGGNLQVDQLQVGAGGPPGTTTNPSAAPLPPGRLPGSLAGGVEAIKAGKGRGESLEQLLQYVPPGGRDLVANIIGGDQDPKDLSSRGQDRDLAIKYANAIGGKDYSANDYAARAKYRAGYQNKAIGNTGGQAVSLGAGLEHLAETSDATVAMHNRGGPASGISHLWNKTVNEGLGSAAAPAASLDTASTKYSGEMARFLTGGHPAEGTMAQYKKPYGPDRRPDEYAAALQADLDLIEGKENEMRRARDTAVGDKDLALKHYPIGEGAAYDTLKARIRHNIAVLKGETTEAPQSGWSNFKVH